MALPGIVASIFGQAPYPLKDVVSICSNDTVMASSHLVPHLHFLACINIHICTHMHAYWRTKKKNSAKTQQTHSFSESGVTVFFTVLNRIPSQLSVYTPNVPFCCCHYLQYHPHLPTWGTLAVLHCGPPTFFCFYPDKTLLFSRGSKRCCAGPCPCGRGPYFTT